MINYFLYWYSAVLLFLIGWLFLLWLVVLLFFVTFPFWMRLKNYLFLNVKNSRHCKYVIYISTRHTFYIYRRIQHTNATWIHLRCASEINLLHALRTYFICIWGTLLIFICNNLPKFLVRDSTNDHMATIALTSRRVLLTLPFFSSWLSVMDGGGWFDFAIFTV